MTILDDLLRGLRKREIDLFLRAAGVDPNDGKIRFVNLTNPGPKYQATYDPATGGVRNGVQ